MSEFTNAEEVAAGMLALIPAAMIGVRAAVHECAPLLETAIKSNASGRPGPNVITGDYRASWTTEYGETSFGGGGMTASATVGTNRPQARRLEYGFVGPDVLGRVYNQPPFPHVQPAVDAIGPRFRDAMQRAVVL